MLARISLTWYTFLEQGRAVRASAGTITRLADVLRLGEDDRRKLASLAGLPTFYTADRRPLPSALHRIVEALEPLPAFGLNHLFDIVVWNAGFQALCHQAMSFADSRDNFLWRLFTEPKRYRLGGDWIVAASLAVKQFRMVFDRRADDKLNALVSELGSFSAEFRRVWTARDSEEDIDHVFRMQIDDDTIEARFAYLSVFASGDYTLCTLVPTDPPSRQTLEALHKRWMQTSGITLSAS